MYTSKALNQHQQLCSSSDVSSVPLKLRWIPVSQHTNWRPSPRKPNRARILPLLHSQSCSTGMVLTMTSIREQQTPKWTLVADLKYPPGSRGGSCRCFYSVWGRSLEWQKLPSTSTLISLSQILSINKRLSVADRNKKGQFCDILVVVRDT